MLGTRIGSYRIVRQIGQGGMGSVFEAVHESIGQRVAVKVLSPDLSRRDKHVQRFFDEARAISKVEHPGLVRLFNFEQLPDGTVYLMMELLVGESLWQRYERLRKEGRWLQLIDCLRVTRQMASTLAAVHEKGILHRDLKPENVMIVADPEAAGKERAKLLDFGIAKFAELPEARKTTVGMVLGTPIYMSPEQCRGADVLTDRTDVYSLGIMLYEMVAGRPPFHAQGGMMMALHMMKEPPPLAEAAPGTPAPICALVHEMLRKDPQSRPSMAQVVSRLEELETAGQVPHFVTQTNHVAPLPAPPPASSRRGLLLLGAVLLLCGLAVFAVVLARRGRIEATTLPVPMPMPAPGLPAPKQEAVAPVPERAPAPVAEDGEPRERRGKKGAKTGKHKKDKYAVPFF